MKKLLLIFACMVSLAYPEQEGLVVKSLDIESSGNAFIVTVELSDHTVWKKVVSIERESVLNDIESDLQAGNKVSLSHKKYLSSYQLGKCNGRKSYKFGLSKDTKSKLLKVKSIKAYSFVYYLTLSDFSVWRSTDRDHVVFWRKNDAVIVGQKNGDSFYPLINIDALVKFDPTKKKFYDQRFALFREAKNSSLDWKYIDLENIEKESLAANGARELKAQELIEVSLSEAINDLLISAESIRHLVDNLSVAIE